MKGKVPDANRGARERAESKQADESIGHRLLFSSLPLLPLGSLTDWMSTKSSNTHVCVCNFSALLWHQMYLSCHLLEALWSLLDWKIGYLSNMDILKIGKPIRYWQNWSCNFVLAQACWVLMHKLSADKKGGRYCMSRFFLRGYLRSGGSGSK